MFLDAGAALRAARDPEEAVVVAQLFEDVAADEAGGTGDDDGWQGHASAAGARRGALRRCAAAGSDSPRVHCRISGNARKDGPFSHGHLDLRGAPRMRLNACELEIDLFCRGLRIPEHVSLEGARGISRTRAGLGSGLEIVIPTNSWLKRRVWMNAPGVGALRGGVSLCR